MVALISGSDLGLLNSSASVLGQRGIIGNPSQGQAGDAAYLNVANGNLILQRRDEILMSQGLDVALLRTYNAQGQLTDDHGDHWVAKWPPQKEDLEDFLHYETLPFRSVLELEDEM